MLSLFAFPKPFQGHIATIQRNAISSWARLRPSCEIFLFGDEEGTAEVAKEFGACHVSKIACNEYGTPLLSDVFEKGQQLAKNDLLCYVNCDIILGSEFMRAVGEVSRWTQRFLMVGECWNLDVTEPLAFDQSGWEEELKALVRLRGTLRGPESIDYFVFPRGLYQKLPPFALGRAWFDNWLIWKARDLKFAAVDATQVVTAVHQDHDYSHVSGGKSYTHHGAEAMRNIELAGGPRHRCRISEATHKLLPTGLKRNWGSLLLRNSDDKQRAEKVLSWALHCTRPLRHLIGLNMANVSRFKSLVTGQR